MNALASFHPNIYKWHELLTKNVWSFRKKTRLCERRASELKDDFDLVFALGCLSAPSATEQPTPYVLYVDSTMKMAQLEYPAWAPFRFSWERRDWMRLEQQAYRRALKIFTFSEYAREELIRDYGIRREKVVAVYWGGNIAEIPQYEKDYGSKMILFVGKDFNRKGGPVLLKAFKEVRKKVNGARLVIVGPARLRISQEGVTLLGRVQEQEKIELYKKASLYVMPSFYEPGGHVFAEAMAFKIPCIGGTRDATPEVIDEGTTGFLVPPHDYNKLATRISYLLANEDLLESMGEKAQRRAKEIFSWNKVAERISHNLR